jgi:hypothetical protein
MSSRARERARDGGYAWIKGLLGIWHRGVGLYMGMLLLDRERRVEILQQRLAHGLGVEDGCVEGIRISCFLCKPPTAFHPPLPTNWKDSHNSCLTSSQEAKINTEIRLMESTPIDQPFFRQPTFHWIDGDGKFHQPLWSSHIPHKYLGRFFISSSACFRLLSRVSRSTFCSQRQRLFRSIFSCCLSQRPRL